ncbi:MAG: glycosyltransferase family 2 protein [Desulfuromusa sp.]|nr:glycosyltransferase family 2 protein [Desulfuromusa sp.]
MRDRVWLESGELLAGFEKTAAVSVVIPCYRADKTIERALASVANQTCKPVEVIVVDDASGDTTRYRLHKLVEKYGSDWLKIHFLSENCGPASARNFGWEQATQPFIAFLDADDSWHRDKIILQFSFMKQHPQISISGHSCGGVSILARKLPRNFQVTNYTLKKLLFRNCLQTPTVMLKSELVLRFPMGSRFGEDYYLWLALLKVGYQAVVIDLPLTTIHKAVYGASGQSAELWQMEKGELKALKAAFNRGSISSMQFGIATVWSLFKYVRRVLLSCLRLSRPFLGLGVQ